LGATVAADHHDAPSADSGDQGQLSAQRPRCLASTGPAGPTPGPTMASIPPHTPSNVRDTLPTTMWDVDPLPVSETLTGRHILVTGATGFLGKVFVSMLLHEVPAVGKLYLLVRERKHETAAQRVVNELVNSPAFDPLRERYSDGLEDWVLERVEVVPGEVTEKNFGL